MKWVPLAGLRLGSALRPRSVIDLKADPLPPLQAGRRGAHRQDDCDRASGPVPAALRRRCTRALRTASGGL